MKSISPLKTPCLFIYFFSVHFHSGHARLIQMHLRTFPHYLKQDALVYVNLLVVFVKLSSNIYSAKHTELLSIFHVAFSLLMTFPVQCFRSVIPDWIIAGVLPAV